MDSNDGVDKRSVWATRTNVVAEAEDDVEKSDRGFASMDPDKQRKIASKGGKAAHAKGTAHEWNSEQAKDAGRKGGAASKGGRGRFLNKQQAESE